MNQIGDLLSKKSGNLPHPAVNSDTQPQQKPHLNEGSSNPLLSFSEEGVKPQHMANTTLKTSQEPADSIFFTPSVAPASIKSTVPVPMLSETSTMHKSTVDLQKVKLMIHSMKDQLNAMLRMLDGEIIANIKMQEHPKTEVLNTGEKIIEGVFNGQAMIGEDGKEYIVPPNYASKSKMVEGDLLKLTVTNRGSYIYKQIGPIERKRLIGELVKDANNEDQWIVLAGGKTFKVLSASISFYKGDSGDEVVLLIPQNGMSEWGAIDNVMKK